MLVLFINSVLAIPKLISIQGKLTNKTNGDPIIGPVDISFGICSDQECNSQAWPTLGYEQHTNVPLAKGIFNVELGSVETLNLDFSQNYWLWIEVNGEDFGETVNLASVGYAFRADDADQLQGKTESELSVSHASTADSATDAQKLGGKTESQLSVSHASTADSATTAAEALNVDWTGIQNMPSGFSDNVDDTGYWTKLGNIIYYNTGNVGIGRTGPTEKLDVLGNIKASGTICGSAGCVGDPVEGLWTQSGSNVYRSTGNVGIGTMFPSQKLHVSGNVKATKVGAGSFCDSNMANCKTIIELSDDNDWAKSGNNVYKTTGKVGIGTSTPSTVLDVSYVCSGCGYGAARIGHSSNVATGDYAVVMGKESTASGTYSLAIGYNAEATNTYSFAHGRFSQATGKSSVALGDTAKALGYGSVALGSGTASDSYDVAMGSSTDASGGRSTAMGSFTEASGFASTAMGSSTKAMGFSSTAMGTKMEVSGFGSFGVSLDNPTSAYELTQDNTMAIMGGNLGVGTVTPEANLEVKGTMKVFGAWQTKQMNEVYRADTDGFVVAYADGLWSMIQGYTDSSDPPTTLRTQNNAWETPHVSITMPVRKGDYWKVTSTLSGTVYWMPLGT